jgi:hypothetical protein
VLLAKELTKVLKTIYTIIKPRYLIDSIRTFPARKLWLSQCPAQTPTPGLKRQHKSYDD